MLTNSPRPCQPENSEEEERFRFRPP